jgi:hypothetical protein
MYTLYNLILKTRSYSFSGQGTYTIELYSVYIIMYTHINEKKMEYN